MKKTLFGTTAIIGLSAISTSLATAAEAPTWRLSGYANFQFYYVDQDFTTTGTPQDHGWYFGVDESELQIDVSGVADNGMAYGFKVEINANTDDGTVADEARLELSGDWGRLQLGDEDGAEDTMNYGGESLMGATGGIDGDFGDVLIRIGSAPSYPTIAGDTSDATKVTYYSPRFSGFQFGASLTPTPNTGDNFKVDGAWENHYGLGVNYDNSFGDIRVQASGVFSAATSNNTGVEDVSAWSVGGVVGMGPFGAGANFTSNGDSFLAAGDDSYYWDVGAYFEIGQIYVSAGYFSSTVEWAGGGNDEFTSFAVTGDYNVAPGLGVYAEIDLIDDTTFGGSTNGAMVLIAGASVSF